MEDEKKYLIVVAKAVKSEEWLKNGAGEDISKWQGIVVKNQRVSIIDWKDLKLSGPLPDVFGKLTALEQLDLSGNQLSDEMPNTSNHADTQKAMEKYANNLVSFLLPLWFKFWLD